MIKTKQSMLNHMAKAHGLVPEDFQREQNEDDLIGDESEDEGKNAYFESEIDANDLPMNPIGKNTKPEQAE